MKKMLIVWMMIAGTIASAQNKVDDERMQRDIEIAENILSTMIKQQLNRHNFFPMEVQGSYLPGYGVTFRLPSSEFGNFFYIQGGNDSWTIDPPMPLGAPRAMTYSISSSNESEDAVAVEHEAIQAQKQAEIARQDAENAKRDAEQAQRNAVIAKKGQARSKNLSRKKINSDSALNSYNLKILEAAKNFIADYGDLLSQLQPNEKIVVTNKGDRNQRIMWAGNFQKQRESILSVDGLRSDISLFRQGKITRDQLMSKFKVMNNEVSDELQPDLELLTSIFNRVYSRDLSKTFFCDDNIYYDRLKDFGAIYYMQVYASSGMDDDQLYQMPTLRLTDVDQETRDQKVKELYPKFEQSIKEDLLEYGRTLKSLKDEETLMFEIVLTKCKNCGIPSTLELSVKNSVLKDYAMGKLAKEAAIAKITIKKGADQ
ncbi:MAG: hypothetical protein QM734_09275 [Cyclobacteriaceae bacterium]